MGPDIGESALNRGSVDKCSENEHFFLDLVIFFVINVHKMNDIRVGPNKNHWKRGKW